VDADVSHLPKSTKKNNNGKIYYQSPVFSIVLLFGFTEIQSQITWKRMQVIFIPLNTSTSLESYLRVKEVEKRQVYFIHSKI
jgi:hypothetical protein